MKEIIQKIRNNKILKIISNIIYTIIFILVLFLLIMVIFQRTSDNEISINGYRIFVVATGSMVPEYNVGDVLVAKEVDPSELKAGDNVAYKGAVGSFNGKVITHKIKSIEKEGNDYKIITQGVANTGEDPEINQTQILGKITYKIITLSLFEKIVSNNYAFYCIIFIPIALLIFKQFRNFMSDDETDDESDNEIDDDDENKVENEIEDKIENKVEDKMENEGDNEEQK